MGDLKDRLKAFAWAAMTVLYLAAAATLGAAFKEPTPDVPDPPPKPQAFIGPELPDFDLRDRWDIMAEALIPVESRGNPLAVNRVTGASGILQFREIMVREANRVTNMKLGTPGVWRFTYEDRFDPHRSVQMFKVIMMHHNRSGTLDRAMEIWNRGYTEREKAAIRSNYARLLAESGQ